MPSEIEPDEESQRLFLLRKKLKSDGKILAGMKQQVEIALSRSLLGESGKQGDDGLHREVNGAGLRGPFERRVSRDDCEITMRVLPGERGPVNYNFSKGL